MGLACTDVTVSVAAEDGRAREPAPTVDDESRRGVHALAAIEQGEQREEELAEPLRGCARWSKLGEGRRLGEGGRVKNKANNSVSQKPRIKAFVLLYRRHQNANSGPLREEELACCGAASWLCAVIVRSRRPSATS